MGIGPYCPHIAFSENLLVLARTINVYKITLDLCGNFGNRANINYTTVSQGYSAWLKGVFITDNIYIKSLAHIVILEITNGFFGRPKLVKFF
jgi:hypothetical protein